PLLVPPAPQPVPLQVLPLELLQVLPLELPEPLLELLGRPPLADQFCNQVQTKPSKRPCQGVFLIKLSYEVDPRSTDKVVLAGLKIFSRIRPAMSLWATRRTTTHRLFCSITL